MTKFAWCESKWLRVRLNKKLLHETLQCCNEIFASQLQVRRAPQKNQMRCVIWSILRHDWNEIPNPHLNKTWSSWRSYVSLQSAGLRSTVNPRPAVERFLLGIDRSGLPCSLFSFSFKSKCAITDGSPRCIFWKYMKRLIILRLREDEIPLTDTAARETSRARIAFGSAVFNVFSPQRVGRLLRGWNDRCWRNIRQTSTGQTRSSWTCIKHGIHSLPLFFNTISNANLDASFL